MADPPRSQPFDGGGELRFGQGRGIRVAGEGQAEEKGVAAGAALKRGNAGVPGDVVVGHKGAAGAIECDEAVIADLARGIGHQGNGLVERDDAVVKDHAEPLIEAMACGTPVLTSAATATQEVAGPHALLVDPLSEASIAQGILTLCSDRLLLDRFAAEGPAYAARFSWEDAARAYERIFAEVARERP